MRVSLRNFVANDVQLIESWIGDGDAKNFMSRCAPLSFDGASWSDDLTRWHVIIMDGRDIGTVWLERNSMEIHTADLGILIADPACRGRGIGTEAILLAENDVMQHWRTDLIRLRVRSTNLKAITCYQRAGYVTTETRRKDIEGVSVEVLHMEHRLPHVHVRA